jgi:LPXTG-motif cell wall-anchored protein
MKTNRLARHRGVRAAARLRVIIAAVGVAALAGASAANVSTVTDSMRGVLVLTEPAGSGDAGTTEDEDDPADPGGGGGGEEPGDPGEDPGGEDPGGEDPGGEDPGGEEPGGGGEGPTDPTTPPDSGGGGGTDDDDDDGSDNGGGSGSGGDNNTAGGGGSDSGGGGLPVTGANAIGIAGLGAAIAAGGVGLVLVTRRRRPESTDA